MEIIKFLESLKLSSMDDTKVLYIAGVVLLIGRLVAIIRKTFWIALAAIIVSVILGVSNPMGFKSAQNDVANVVGGAVDPLKGDNYVEMAEDILNNN